MTQETLYRWAQYNTVGPKGYADSDGCYVNEFSTKAAKEVVAGPEHLDDICWVDFLVFVGKTELDPYKADESLVATSRRSQREVYFKPVSEVIAQGRLPKLTAKWVGYLARSEGGDRPDRFAELVQLLPDSA